MTAQYCHCEGGGNRNYFDLNQLTPPEAISSIIDNVEIATFREGFAYG